MKQGWSRYKLSEACEIRPPKRLAYLHLKDDDLVSFGPMADLNEHKQPFIPSSQRTLKSVYSGYTYFGEGDVILAKITPCFENGKLGIATGLVNGVGFGSSEYVVFRPSESLSNEFLYYFLEQSSFRKIGKELMTGAVGHKRIPKDFYENTKIPIPPLPEQKRIVAKLDQAFEAIDKTKANVERNLQNAKDLFQSKLNQIFSQRSDRWVEKKLEELGTLTSSKRIYKNEYVAEGIPFYRSKEVKELAHNRDISLELFITTQRYAEIKERFGIPNKGDILLTAVGTIGEMYVVGENEEFYFKDGNIMWLKDFKSLNTFYLKYALTSYVEQLKAMSQGSAYNALTIEKLKKYSVPVPPNDIQAGIVSSLDNLADETANLESKYLQEISALDELKKSILQKAFNGEL